MEPHRQPTTSPAIDPLPSDTQTGDGNPGELAASGRTVESISPHGTRGQGQETLGGAGSGSASASGSRDGGRRASSEQGRVEAGGSTTATAAPPRSIRRRNRMITSCLECRRRKMKCDRLHPCTNCAKSNRDCVFLAPATDTASRMRLAEVKDQVGHLEGSLGREPGGRQLDELHHGAGSKTTATREDGDEAISNRTDPKENIPEDEKNLRPSEMAVQDAVYEDEADDDTYDLGFKVGKMIMTDRIGGLFRPKLADELSIALELLNLSDDDKQLVQAPQAKPPRVRELLPESSVDAGSSYSAPRSDLIFGNAKQLYSLADFLPSRVAADRVLTHYWEAVHPIAKVVHRPTFESQYGQFWTDISKGLEPVYSLQSVVFAVLFTASVSMSENMSLTTFGIPQKKLAENFRLATEMALGNANFLKTAKTQTLQAFVMYMIPMCRNELSRSHSTLVGAGIRLAECMGLHRDPEEYGIDPVETHVRRIIWYQLCFLDLKTCDQQGPRPSIRPDDFSTKFPLNVDDADFRLPPSPSLVDRSEFTDMTLALLRFEANELNRSVYFDRALIEKESASLTQIVSKVEARRKAIYAKYGPMVYVCNPLPIHRAAQLFLSTSICSSYVRLLHPFLLSVKVRIPDRLRQIIISAGIQQLETAIGLEAAPEMQPWAWYLGSCQQYHTAFLLLFEVFLNPMRRETDRIWRCLDYVFETSPLPPQAENTGCSEISREELLAHRKRKGVYVIQQVLDRTLAFQETRKPKPPVKLDVVQVWLDAHLEPQSVPQQKESDEPFLTPVIDLVARGQQSHSSELPQTTLDTVMSHTQATPTSTSAPFQGSLDTPSDEQPKQSLPGQQGSYAYDYSDSHHALRPSYQTHPDTSSLRPPEPMTYLPDLKVHSSTFETTGPSQTHSTNIVGREQEHNRSDGAFQRAVGDTGGGNSRNMPQGRADSEDLPMLDIDWDEWDKLFPPEINTGELDLSTLPEMYPTIATQVPQEGFLPNYDNAGFPMQEFSSFSYPAPTFTYPSSFSQPQPPP